MIKKILFIIMLMAGSFAMLAFVLPQDQKIGGPWDIPEEYKMMENPHKGDASLARLGRAGYNRHCRSCHGNRGKGDGPMANTLETFPGDFTDADFMNKYSDGEIYYMSFIGRDEMPNFESLIPDIEERWAIVNYVRAFVEE
jgi:mono/diheme cytochrome c family protein